ncbi:MAG: hypothetical protein HY063_13085 [Bacteroidetes bacterium]|nr:hypothetical protein [Bacteroidota bacterium]
MKISEHLEGNELCPLQQEILFLHLHEIKTGVIWRELGSNRRDVETINSRLNDIFCPHIRSIEAVKEKVRECPELVELLHKNMNGKHAKLIAQYGSGGQPVTFSKKESDGKIHILIHRG